jgi:class 3 adenylate cyclase
MEQEPSVRREAVTLGRGTSVKTTGNGWLAQSGSVTDAVRSSIEIQDAMSALNESLPRDRRLEIRIGINLGEVIFEGDDIYGTGVNVAARLESLAAHDQIQGIPDLAFDDMGEQHVKNIARPIHCYALRLGSHRRLMSNDIDKAAPPASGRAPRRRSQGRLRFPGPDNGAGGRRH